MTDRLPDDPTRDIRLPPVPGTPPPAMPHQRAATAQPAPPEVHDPIDDEPTDRLLPAASPERQRTLAFDAPAGDHGNGPPFGSPGTGGPPPVVQPPAPVAQPPAPAPPAGRADPDSRKWPWVLLVLLPLVVIVAAGLVLALLLGG